MKGESLNKQLRIDTIIGGLMLLPIIEPFLPGSNEYIGLPSTQAASLIIFGLMIWTFLISWFMHFKDIKRVEILIPLFILISGLVVSTLIISFSMGFGIVSIFAACTLPYLYSRFHVKKLRGLIESDSTFDA